MGLTFYFFEESLRWMVLKNFSLVELTIFFKIIRQEINVKIRVAKGVKLV